MRGRARRSTCPEEKVNEKEGTVCVWGDGGGWSGGGDLAHAE